MKIIGMSIRSTAMRFCRSRPLRSGRATSRTRQLGARIRGRARNSCADANVSGCQPAKRISDSSDSRTETSSSTTNTIGVACDIGDLNSWSAVLAKLMSYPYVSPGRKNVAHRSGHSKSGIEGLTQSRIAEWLEQALHGTLLEQFWTDGLISVSGDENDRNLLPAKLQFPLEIGSAHARHGDVEDQTSGPADAIGREELFRRRECLGRKAELPQQVG